MCGSLILLILPPSSIQFMFSSFFLLFLQIHFCNYLLTFLGQIILKIEAKNNVTMFFQAVFMLCSYGTMPQNNGHHNFLIKSFYWLIQC